VSSEIVFIDTYSCPHCRAELESGSKVWQGWQRCPACGLPSLPPAPTQFHRKGPPRGGLADDGVLVISDSPEILTGTDPLVATVNGQSSHVSGARLVFRTGLCVSAGLAFIFFLDRRTTNTVIFASLAFGFFLLLVRLSAKRRSAS
jgi:hypothetical protein